MEVILIFLVLLIMIFGVYFFSNQEKLKNYPPSPKWRLPVLGHILQIRPSLHKKLLYWKESMGPIVSLQLGSFPAVAISDPELIKEAMADPRFSGRPDIPLLMARSGGTRRGVIFSHGAEWVELRRFVMRHLRNFGFGKKSMQSIILNEAGILIGRLRATAQTPIIFKSYASVTVINSIWSIVASVRFEHDDPKTTLMLKSVETTFQHKSLIRLFVPWVPKYFSKLSGFHKFVTNVAKQYELIQSFVDAHVPTLQPGQPRDLIDAFLEQNQNCTNPESAFYGSLGKKVMLAVFRDLFTAGTDTTSTALAFCFMYLSAFPEAQEKMFLEIDKVVGRSRLPSLNDRSQMLYTEAVMLETFRLSSFVPLGVLHSTLADAELGGYNIPKDTMVITNIFGCHYDEKYWGDPEKFRPERFLSEDGQKIVKHDAMLIFSTGKRVCLGETMARAEFFLFSTSILQQFKLTFDPAAKPATLEPQLGVISSTATHKLIFTEREKS